MANMTKVVPFPGEDEADPPGLHIASFPVDLRPLLRSLETDDNGYITPNELESMLRAYKAMKSADKKGTISVSTMPEKFRSTLKTFDRDGDGTIDPVELARAADLYSQSKKNVGRLTKGIIAISCFCVLLIGVNTGMTYAMVELAKDSKVSPNGVMQTMDGGVVKVGSVDTQVKDNQLVDYQGAAITTAQTFIPTELDSRMPDEVLEEMRFFKVTSPTGAKLKLVVQGVARLPRRGSLYGNVVVIITSIGQVELDGTALHFYDNVGPVFKDAGFLVSSAPGTTRRLLGIYELQGFFNKLPPYTLPSGEQVRPSAPKVQHVKYTRYTTCTAFANKNQCGGQNDGVIDGPAWTYSGNTTKHPRYAMMTGELWANEDGAVEITRALANGLPDFQFVKVHDVTTGNATQFQMSLTETNFCAFPLEQPKKLPWSNPEDFEIGYSGSVKIPGSTMDDKARRFILTDQSGEFPGSIELYEVPIGDTYYAKRYVYVLQDEVIWWVDFNVAEASFQNVRLPQSMVTMSKNTASCFRHKSERLQAPLAHFKIGKSPFMSQPTATFEKCQDCFVEAHVRHAASHLRLDYGWTWANILEQMSVFKPNGDIDLKRALLDLKQATGLQEFHANATAYIEKYALSFDEALYNYSTYFADVNATIAANNALLAGATAPASGRRRLSACCDDTATVSIGGDPFPCQMDFGFNKMYDPSSFCSVNVECSGYSPPAMPLVSFGGSGTISWDPDTGNVCQGKLCVTMEVGCPEKICGEDNDVTVIEASLCASIFPYEYESPWSSVVLESHERQPFESKKDKASTNLGITPNSYDGYAFMYELEATFNAMIWGVGFKGTAHFVVIHTQYDAVKTLNRCLWAHETIRLASSKTHKEAWLEAWRVNHQKYGQPDGPSGCSQVKNYQDFDFYLILTAWFGYCEDTDSWWCAEMGNMEAKLGTTRSYSKR